MSRPLLVFFLAFPLAFAAPKHKASDYFKICSRNELKNDKCIRESLLQAKDKIIEGIPELKLHSLDPLEISKVSMTSGSGNFKLHVDVNDYVARGMKDMKIQSVKVGDDLKWINITIWVPALMAEARYKMSGKVLSMPVSGDGKSYINMTDVTNKMHMVMKKVQKKGKDYLQVEKVNFNLKNKGGSLHFTNLFNGDKTLGDAFNKFVNENQDEVFLAYKDLPENAFSQMMLETVNNMLMSFPYSEWVKP